MANLPNVVITDKNPGKGVRTVYDCQAEGWADVLVWPDLDVAKYDLETLGERDHAVILVTKPENTTRAESTAHALDGLGTKSQAYAVESGNPFKGVFSSGGRPVIDSGGGEENTGPSSRKKAKRGRFDPTDAKVWSANDMDSSAEVEWHALHRLPKAAVSLLVGDEGIGKSALSVALVAATSTGAAVPWFGMPTREPQDVLLILTEDDWATAVRPRLEAAGADLARISVLCADSDGAGTPVFPGDESKITAMDPPPALIVVDAWLDTVPSGLSVRNPQDARVALGPWRDIVTTTRAACLLLTHTNRLATANARDKYGATAELRKKARMALYSLQDEEGHLVVGPEKSNLTAPVNATVLERYDAGDGIVRLRHVRDADQTVGQYVVEQASEDRPESDAVSWLRGFLTENGPTSKPDVIAAAKAAGESYSQRTLERAIKAPGMDHQRQGYQKPSLWFITGGREVDFSAASTDDEDTEK